MAQAPFRSLLSGPLLGLLCLGLASVARAQTTLVDMEWQATVPFNSPAGDDYSAIVLDSGTIKWIGWFAVGYGWRNLRIRYTLPSGAFFDERLSRHPRFVDPIYLASEEAGGIWTLNLLESEPARARPRAPGLQTNVRTGVRLFVQRHADPNMPITGLPTPELDGLDSVMLGFMREYGFEAATLAVERNRTRIYERGFGWQDRERTIPINPQAVMRLASMTVLVTARGIQELVEDGLLQLNERAFDVLGIPPLGGFPIADSSIMQLTVDQLLHHSSGFADQAPSPHEIGLILGLGRNATLEETIAYMWSIPLLFQPGTSGAFSHFGYQVLGKIIETRSGMSYDSYVHSVVGLESGISTFRVARDTPEEAYPNEVWYAGEWMQPHEADFYFTGPLVEQSYSIDYSSRPGAGSVVASARDFVRFLSQFYYDGSRKPANLVGVSWNSPMLSGSLPGTTTVGHDQVSPDGSSLRWVALINERVSGVDCNTVLYQAIEEYLAAVTAWPDTGPRSRRR